MKQTTFIIMVLVMASGLEARNYQIKKYDYVGTLDYGFDRSVGVTMGWLGKNMGLGFDFNIKQLKTENKKHKYGSVTGVMDFLTNKKIDREYFNFDVDFYYRVVRSLPEVSLFVTAGMVQFTDYIPYTIGGSYQQPSYGMYLVAARDWEFHPATGMIMRVGWMAATIKYDFFVRQWRLGAGVSWSFNTIRVLESKLK